MKTSRMRCKPVIGNRLSFAATGASQLHLAGTHAFTHESVNEAHRSRARIQLHALPSAYDPAKDG